MKDYLEQILDSLAVSGGELGEQLGRLLLLEVHDGVEHHVDGIHNEEGAVHLVHKEDGADALGNGLTQHGLGLHAHACMIKKVSNNNCETTFFAASRV